MSAYTHQILRFGLATPALFNCVLLGAVLILSQKLQQARARKQLQYEQHMARLATIKEIEAEVAPKRKGFESQKRILQADPNQLFTRISDSILSRYQSIELERTGMVFTLDRGRIGRLMQVDAARVKSSFEGGYGPMQEALLQVESLMPQSLLEEFKVTRNSEGQPRKQARLSFEMTHICWKANEAAQ